MQFIDSHAHLTDPAFDQDRDVLISQVLPAAQIVKSVEIGCAPEEWQPSLDLAQKYPTRIVPVLGVHPEYARKFTASHAEPFQKLLQDPRVAAVITGQKGNLYFYCAGVITFYFCSIYPNLSVHLLLAM
ncbi:MAG: TatD family hydrolase [Lachnospiraceae bacterium]|nr:TatD family hydrolase [Lachnospiraceae bacterium]